MITDTAVATRPRACGAGERGQLLGGHALASRGAGRPERPSPTYVHPGCGPGLAVEAVARVEDVGPGHHVRERRRVDGPELRPLRQVEHDVRAGRRVERGVGVLQLGGDPLRRYGGRGVVDGHHGAVRVEPPGHVEGRRVADVVGVRLERRTQYGDPVPGKGGTGRRTEELAGQLDHPVAATGVDRLHPREEVEGVADPELVGPGAEGPHVLGQAPPAVAEACVEEPPADAGVVPDRVGQGGDVGAGLVADVGDGVDERDLGGQEGVRGRLDQLGGGEVGHHHRGVREIASA